MSAARPSLSGRPLGDAGGAQYKRRNLSLASISIPSILKRKPLPVDSPVRQQRSTSIDSPRSIRLQQPLPNILSPITSHREPEFVVRDLDEYVHYNALYLFIAPKG
jgi:hypothetical protein